MKTSFWFILLVIMAGYSLQAQELNKMIIDERLEKEVLIGYCDRSGLLIGEFGDSYVREYQEYVPDKKIVKKIKKHDTDYNIVLVLATWCHDSKEQVPRFYRILDDARLSEELLTVICVDGNKTGGELLIEHLGIELVPTFIFYRDGEEIGRIIETPGISLEEDMWEIIN
jgi:thiol-disulfide isomerase/thioredoxin